MKGIINEFIIEGELLRELELLPTDSISIDIIEFCIDYFSPFKHEDLKDTPVVIFSWTANNIKRRKINNICNSDEIPGVNVTFEEKDPETIKRFVNGYKQKTMTDIPESLIKSFLMTIFQKLGKMHDCDDSAYWITGGARLDKLMENL